jgi:hypothetical protein
MEIDSLLVEVLGVQWGPKTAKELNYTMTIVFDAEVVVKCINSKV